MSSRRRPPREIVRDRDGNLFDVDEHRPITIAELAEDIRDGGRFRAREQHSDVVCTQQVLLKVLRQSALSTPFPTPAMSGAGLPGVAGLLGDVLARASHRDDEPAPRRSRPARPRRGASGIPQPADDREETER